MNKNNKSSNFFHPYNYKKSLEIVEALKSPGMEWASSTTKRVYHSIKLFGVYTQRIILLSLNQQFLEETDPP